MTKEGKERMIKREGREGKQRQELKKKEKGQTQEKE